MNTQRDDSELVRRACAGDRGALAELVETARARMYPTAYAELRHYDDAQDAVGAAILQVCLHLRELRDPTRLHGWMHSIVRNEARRIRRARVPEAPDGVFNIDEEEAPSPALPASLLRLDIERALYRLPWDEARAVALFYLKGESIRQIARRLDRPEGTVKRWLCLGRRQLARELEAYAPLTPALKRELRRVLVHSVGAHPTRVAADPGANRLYVADATGALTILDGSANAVAAHVSVGRGALALAVNPVSNKIYLAHAPVEKDRVTGVLSVIDGRSYEVVARVEVGNTPRAVA
ncbi:MAG TPA: sigma-70 family RNA polymerase sigma factor, partial [Armatimonadota bacterium]|nr:sigma-70 family RNA polymerase sigma factor [Armatimonadota bacterium]